MRSRLMIPAGLLASALALVGGPAQAQLTFSLSPPGGLAGVNQASPVQGQPGSLTETFDGLALATLPASGSLAIGSFTAANSFISNDYQWGGAGGSGNYGSSGNLSITVQPSKYVGFWWSAVNIANEIKLYDSSSVLLGSLDATALIAVLGSPTSPLPVIASDGLTYSGAAYYGNPNFAPKVNGGEPYAYVHLRLADPSLSIARIDLNGAGFEYDNLTISPRYDVPGPLPVLGCAAAFGWSRRLRRRIGAGR